MTPKIRYDESIVSREFLSYRFPICTSPSEPMQKDKWFSLAEYIEFFCDPVYVELESEKAWPVQKFEKITGYLNEE